MIATAMWLVLAIGLVAFLAAVVSVAGMAIDTGPRTVVHEIAVACYAILTVSCTHCACYLRRLSK